MANDIIKRNIPMCITDYKDTYHVQSFPVPVFLLIRSYCMSFIRQRQNSE